MRIDNFICEKERDERNTLPYSRRLETKLNETERWICPSRLVCFQGGWNDNERTKNKQKKNVNDIKRRELVVDRDMKIHERKFFLFYKVTYVVCISINDQ